MKVLMYSQFHNGKRNVGRPWLRFKEKLKYNLNTANIPIQEFELAAENRANWRNICYRGITNFEKNRLNDLRDSTQNLGPIHRLI